jgi:hypothetical protein
LEKSGRGLPATTNYLKVLVNDEDVTLTKLNRLCGMKNNAFSRTRIPSCRNPIVFPEIDRNEEEPIEDGVETQSSVGEITNITKSKILTHFLKGKISFVPLETIQNVLSEFEHLESLVKLTRKSKDEKIQ